MDAKAAGAYGRTEMKAENGMLLFPVEFEGRVDADIARLTADFNPIARSLSDLVSAKQTGLAKFLARCKGLDENDIAENLFGCDFSELSKTAASLVIYYLEDSAANLKARLRLAG